MLALPKPALPVVVDASVIAKALLPQERTVKISDYSGYPADEVAPSIISFEIASLLAKHQRLGTFTTAEARSILASWYASIDDDFIMVYPFEDYRHRAFDIACELRHPFYDCCYLALAQMLGCPLVTADRQLAERGKSVHSNIILVA